MQSMNETQTRQTLIAICEVLKGHYIDLGSLDRSFYALFQALQQYHPELEQQYLAEAGKSLQAENPAMRARLERLDELLAQLKSS
jgi:hypothetical protein